MGWTGSQLLPTLHRDPFDRMLVCQAIEHDRVLLTPDPFIVQYPVRTQGVVRHRSAAVLVASA